MNLTSPTRTAAGVAATFAGLTLLTACTSSGRAGSSIAATPPGTSPGTSQVASSAAPPSTGASSSAPPAGSAEWPTYHGSPDRHGVSITMPAVRGPLKVAASIRLDGAVYASPIVVGGITIVATENDTVYALDRSYRQVWKHHLGSPSPAGERPCGNIDPLGITGTPVYDPTTGDVYVAPEYAGPPRHELVALDLRTGAVRFGKSLDLPGVETRAMQERGALTVSGTRVFVPFGGLDGDCGGYKGRVVGVERDGTGSPVSYTVPTTREAGIWTPPGPVVDSAGNLYESVGNGESGVGDPYDHSDSVLELSPALTLVDSYSPRTWPTDNDADLDLGSQGPTLVGRDWVFIAGKSGTAYVLRRGHLGGIGGEISSADMCVSFGGTAVVGEVVYVPCTDGLRAVRIDDAGTMHVLWHASTAIAGSPVVGGGRVWALAPQPGVLYALDPKTGKGTDRVDVGVTSRFATPAISGADILVPTLTGLTVVRTS